MCFTALTDYNALRFILSYGGPNAVILCLQMRLMLWAMNLYHRPGTEMVPNYWSRLGVDLCFDEMARNYLNLTTNLRKLYPPVTGTMLPENIPGYRRPTIRSSLPPPTKVARCSDTDVDPSISPLLTAFAIDASGGHHYCLQTVPILTGLISPADIDKSTKPMYHGYITALAAEVSLYSFVIYGFNYGHFLSRTLNTTLPFEVVTAADTRLCG